MRIDPTDLATRLGGQLVGSAGIVTGFATDSSQVQPGDAFLAIKGARVDGHDFVAGAIEKGASLAVVTRSIDGPHILVNDLADALAQMAKSYRDAFTGPVVGITGSAGKTTTKEFLGAALTPLGPVLKTTGNRNTEWTSPLLWAEIAGEHRSAVVELAMRGFGQIAHLARFTQPTIGIITNIGYAHIEMVGSREGIAQAKGEILEALPSDGTAILWSEDEYLGTLIARAGERPIKTFGYSGNADCHISGYQATTWESATVTGTLDGKSWTAEMPTVGRHLALNVAAAVLAASVAGVNPAEAAANIRHAVLPPLRMEIRDFKGATLVMDNYNASPPAVLSALETLSDIPCEGRRIAVLGTMRELGDESEDAHREVGRALSRSKVDLAILFGPEVEHIASAARAKGMDADKVKVAGSLAEVSALLADAGSGDTILVKGSRALELEKAFD